MYQKNRSRTENFGNFQNYCRKLQTKYVFAFNFGISTIKFLYTDDFANIYCFKYKIFGSHTEDFENFQKFCPKLLKKSFTQSILVPV